MKVRSATYFTIKDESGDLKSIGETQFNKLVEDAKGKQEDAPEPVRQQTFTIVEAESIEDLSLLCPDQTVAVDLFNRGASLKQLNEIRDLMESDLSGDGSFQTVDGAYDLTDVVGQKTERRKMSPMDKILKALGGLSEDEKQAVISKLLSAQTA